VLISAFVSSLISEITEQDFDQNPTSRVLDSWIVTHEALLRSARCG